MSGLWEGWTFAVGQADGEIGGYRLTRLTATAVAGQLSLSVETTTGWEDSGKVGVDGQVYLYASKTATSLDGLTHVSNGQVAAGTFALHLSDAAVIDLTGAFSALDKLRRSFLTEYAEGEDLDVIGRDLGVPRLPSVPDDDVYRAIVQALAYNPRGTVYGLELALTAMVGEGNFTIYENPVSFPNTVFISLSDEAGLSDESLGKYFVGGVTDGLANDPSDVVVDVLGETEPIIKISGIRWKDENFLSDYRNDRPSVETRAEYEGDPGTQVWLYNGINETTRVTVAAGDYVELDDGTATDEMSYTHRTRLRSESVWEVELHFLIPNTASLSTSAANARQWGVQVDDGDLRIQWGTVHNAGGGFDVGLCDDTSMVDQRNLAYDVWHTVRIVRVYNGNVLFYVNGQFASGTLTPATTFPASTLSPLIPEVTWGKYLNAVVGGVIARVKQVGVFSRTHTDYAAIRGSSMEVDLGGDDVRVSTAAPGWFVAGDTGKRMRVYGGTLRNAWNGLNNGVFKMTYISAQVATCAGPEKTNGLVSSAGANFRALGEPEAFQFPDDLGKRVVVVGGANAGTYYISDMFREGSNHGVNLVDDFDTEVAEKTSEVALSSTFPVETAATLVPDSGMTWRLDPNFDNETGLSWEVGDGFSRADTTVTLRQDLPLPANGDVWPRVLSVHYSKVLSAQILEDAVVDNDVESEEPLRYDYYPVYVSDPLGHIKRYLDQITAAGVIPEYRKF